MTQLISYILVDYISSSFKNIIKSNLKTLIRNIYEAIDQYEVDYDKLNHTIKNINSLLIDSKAGHSKKLEVSERRRLRNSRLISETQNIKNTIAVSIYYKNMPFEIFSHKIYWQMTKRFSNFRLRCLESSVITTDCILLNRNGKPSNVYTILKCLIQQGK